MTHGTDHDLMTWKDTASRKMTSDPVYARIRDVSGDRQVDE